MNWINNFYKLQYDLIGKPSDPKYQQDRIDILKKHQVFSKSKLLELGGGFGVVDIIPSGYMDYDKFIYNETTSIDKALSSTFVLKKLENDF